MTSQSEKMDKFTEIPAFKQKKSDQVQFASTLLKFIAQQYGQQAANQHKDVLEKIQGRRNGIQNLSDNSEGARTHLLAYAREMEYIIQHFPVNEKRVNLTFTWYDCFTQKRLSQDNGHYDIMSTLFNAAAVETQIAVAQNRASSEGIVTATKKLKSAMSILSFIKNNLCAKVIEKVTSDLAVLLSICSSHCQQCVLEKALDSAMKNDLLAKLAAAAGALYHNSAITVDNSTAKEFMGKGWVAYLTAKMLYYKAFAEYYQAKFHKDEMEFGKCLCRYDTAIKLLNQAKEHNYYLSPGFKSAIQKFITEVEGQYKLTEKDNFQIYHERVPDYASLPGIEEKNLAKFDEVNAISDLCDKEGLDLPDPFKKLLPIAIIEGRQTYVEKCNSIIEDSYKKARETRDNIKSKLADIGLPGSVFAAEKKVGFPDNIHKQIAAINADGGVTRIAQLQAHLNEISFSASNQLTQLNLLLDQEEQDDNNLRSQFGIRWARTPSATLNLPMKKQITNYQAKLLESQKADKIVEKKIAESSIKFKKFNLSPKDLDSTIPSPAASSSSGQNSLYGQSLIDLKSKLAALDDALVACEKKELEIRQWQAQNEASISDKLLDQQQNISVAINKEVTIVDMKLKEFEPLKAKLESIFEETKQKNEIFMSCKQADNQNNNREAVIQDVVRTIDRYREVVDNLKEGINFYSKMQDIFNKLQEKEQGYLFARDLEKKDLITNLQRMEATNPYGSDQGPMYPSMMNYGQQQQYQQPQQFQQYQQPKPNEYYKPK